MVSLFGTELNEAEQDALDNMVVDYAGKLVALKIVGPGIDYWGKQPTQVSATGRNENKTWASRAADLKDLRKQLLEDTRGMWPDVEPLLPSRRNTIGTPIPTTRNLSQAGHVTPNPDDFESPYGLPTTGVNQGIGGVGGT